MPADKYNDAIPDLCGKVTDFTPWEQEFMTTIRKQYENTGTYSIGQKKVLDGLIKKYIDGIVEGPEDKRIETGPFAYGERIVTRREEGGYHVFVDSYRVGFAVTRKEQMIIGAWLSDALESIEYINGERAKIRNCVPPTRAADKAPVRSEFPTAAAEPKDDFTAADGKPRF